MMKLFIFLVFALTVFARESLLRSAVSDIFSQLMEERSAEAEVGGWTWGYPGIERRQLATSENYLSDIISQLMEERSAEAEVDGLRGFLGRHFGGRRQLATRENYLSDIISQLMEERSAEAEVDGLRGFLGRHF